MRTRLTALIVLILGLLAGNGVAAAQQPPPRAELVTVDWLEHKSTEGRYRVEFPSVPKLDTQEAKTSAGTSFKQYFALSTDASGMYMVGYFDYSSQQTYSLDKGRDGMINAVNGTLLNDQAINLNGAPGREFKIEAKLPNSTEAFSIVRMYDVSGRVYILQHMFYKAADPATADADTQKFFKSFAVIPSR